MHYRRRLGITCKHDSPLGLHDGSYYYLFWQAVLNCELLFHLCCQKSLFKYVPQSHGNEHSVRASAPEEFPMVFQLSSWQRH